MGRDMTLSRLFPVELPAVATDEYLTPKWVFDALGLGFDLDVAAPYEDTHVPADRKYTRADDGLSQPWVGRVWMNPPYSEVTPWVSRFIAHSCGVALLPFAKSNWLNRIWAEADGLALLPRMGSFVFDAGRKTSYPVFLTAFGDECVEAIGRLGRVREALVIPVSDGGEDRP